MDTVHRYDGKGKRLGTTTDQKDLDLQMLLDRTVGGASIGANLAKAVAAGTLVAQDGGMWSLAQPPLAPENWRFSAKAPPFPCFKLMGFLFRGGYGRGAVPHGCRTCYKVQIKPRSLRELQATYTAAQTLPYAFKSGVALAGRYQSGPYTTLFYLDSLAQARQAHAEMAELMSKIAPDLPLTIKRGCTEYEIFCGPSDKFTFADDLPEIEAALLARLQPVTKKLRASPPPQIVFMRWIQAAYQIGDETYRDFTGGRRLYPETVSYPVKEDGDSP